MKVRRWLLILLLALPTLLLAGPAVGAAVPGFEVSCSFSHALADDPIVYPQQPGVSHLHQYFGNTGADAFSTAASLRTSGGTTCARPADKAGYWSPAVYSAGQVLTPLRLHSYYRWGQVDNLASIDALPAGAALVAGNHDAEAPQPTSVVGWNCGRQGESLSNRPKDCRDTHHGMHGTPQQVVHVFFPNCLRTGAAAGNPASYAYSHHGRCGTGYRPVVRLSYDVAYPAKAPGSYTLAGLDGAGHHITTASTDTFHADFLNGWDQAVLERLVHDCVQAGRECGRGG